MTKTVGPAVVKLGNRPNSESCWHLSSQQNGEVKGIGQIQDLKPMGANVKPTSWRTMNQKSMESATEPFAPRFSTNESSLNIAAQEECFGSPDQDEHRQMFHTKLGKDTVFQPQSPPWGWRIGLNRNMWGLAELSPHVRAIVWRKRGFQ